MGCHPQKFDLLPRFQGEPTTTGQSIQRTVEESAMGHDLERSLIGSVNKDGAWKGRGQRSRMQRNRKTRQFASLGKVPRSERQGGGNQYDRLPLGFFAQGDCESLELVQERAWGDHGKE